MKLTTATVCEARPVSLSYFAAKRAVLLALGALAGTITEPRSTPPMPRSLKSTSKITGVTISLIAAAP